MTTSADHLISKELKQDLARKAGRTPKNGEGSADDLPEAIRRISEGVQRLSRLGLNRKAVIVLLRHETGIGIGVIESVLDGLAELARKYTT